MVESIDPDFYIPDSQRDYAQLTNRIALIIGVDTYDSVLSQINDEASVYPN